MTIVSLKGGLKMDTFKKVMMTVGSGIISFVYLFIWLILFGIAGVLMMVDWIHWIWTRRRIAWIKIVMDGWRDLFDHPFTRA